jgi:tellurite resistance protein
MSVPSFFSELDLNFEQVKVLTHALVTVAKVDGIHDNEMSLIREFYQSCARAGDPRLEDVAKGSFSIEKAKVLFDSPPLAKMFVKSTILLAFADGEYAQGEDDLIRQWGAALGVSPSEVDALYEATKEHMMAALAHVQNVEALKAVRKSLDRKS